MEVQHSDREAARRAGATGYVEKPVTARQLPALVARYRSGTPRPATR